MITFQIILIPKINMDSSDEDFLPDPERPGKRKEPPDRGSGTDEPFNQQSGLDLHDVFSKGKCFFII